MANSIYKALLEVQKEICNPQNTATNPFFKSKYAPLPDILNQVRPLLNKHGLILIQDTGSNEDGSPYVQTKLVGENEEIKSEKLLLTPDKKGVQGIGSAITYGRRYQLSALLGISSEDDNDGNSKPTNKAPEKAPGKNKPAHTPKKQSKTSQTSNTKKQPKSAMKNAENEEETSWKALTKRSPALKKVCDVLSRGGFDIDPNTVYVEANSMNTNGLLTDKELDEIEIILGKKPA